ncbi:putative 2-dehydro-3-deoxygalactonokinase DgoK1 [Fodinibius salicampi]
MVTSSLNLTTPHTDSYFLGCDWGTSSFRLKLLEWDSGKTLVEISNAAGIKELYKQWSEYRGTLSRIDFYRSFLNDQISELSKQTEKDLASLPLVLSGMGSSSIGMKELSYTQLPISLSKPKLNVEFIKKTRQFSYDIYLISGVCSSKDVMRGEETQLLGIASKLNIETGCFLLTGTHSKHVFVKENFITAFKTYMTGELFDLISSKSILSNSVEKGEVLNPEQSFKKGIKLAQEENLLHSLFTIRANDLLNSSEPTDNYDFLSGLLIGTELNELCISQTENIVLWGDSQLTLYYKTALDVLGLDYIIPELNPQEDITSAGQRIILNQMIND